MPKENISQLDSREDALEAGRPGGNDEVLFSWQTQEFQKYNFVGSQLTFLIVAGIALLIYGLITANYLFVVIIIMVAVVVYIFDTKEPATIDVHITKEGVVIGDKVLTYEGDLKSFWILYNPPEVKTLNFDRQQLIFPNINLQLESENPLKIREVLLRYLPEDMEKEEHLSEKAARKLGI
ncbi:hypothetical protein KJ903_04250 [Patescibacteria group bacterium]|nr:hypothetical protein [Patescibacteria group bacterium]